MRRALRVLCLVLLASCGDDGFTPQDAPIDPTDVTAPDTVITSGPSATTSNLTATFELAGEPADDAASFECSLDGATFAVCTSPRTESVTDGPHSFRARAIDATGNVDRTPASHDWTVDANAPAVTITGPEGLTNAATIVWRFTATRAVSTECSLDGAAFAACTSPYTAGALSEGSHSFTVRALDGAGNQGEASRSITIDRSAPTVTITDGPAGLTNQTRPTWTFTTSSDATSTRCRIDNAAFAACTGSFMAPTLTAGDHTFEVEALDAAENAGVATRTVTVDFLPPNVVILTGPSGLINTATATFTFSTSGSPTVTECRIDTAAFGTCTTATSHTATALAPGAHTFEVRVADAAGNELSRTRAFSVDTEAPTVTITSAPPDPSPIGLVAFGFTVTGDPTVTECRFDTAAFVACTGSFTRMLADGSHTFEIHVADAAGNESTVTRTFAVDTTAPTVTITGGPTGVTADPTPMFTFTTDGAPSVVECRVDAGAFAACVSPSTTSSLGAGAHTFEVRASDTAGNFGADTRTFSVDTTAPPVSITLAPPSPSNDPTATFEFTTIGATTVTCRFDTAAAAPCTSPITSAPLAEGTHTFTVEGCNNLDVCANDSRTVVIDLTAPVIAITSGPADGASISDPEPVFGFTVTGSPVITECRVTNGSAPDPAFAACTSPFTVPFQPEGTSSFEVRARDAAGNVALASRTFIVDTQGLSIVITGGPSGPDDLDPPNPFTFTVGSGATDVQCRIDGRALEACPGGMYLTPAVFLDGAHEGPQTFTVIARDAAGNTSTASRGFVVDTLDPAVVITGPGTSPPTNDNTPTFSYTVGQTGTTPIVERCRFDAAAFASCTSPVTAGTLGEGPHTFEVEAEDPAGNIGTASRAFIVDTQAPSITITTPIPSRTGNRRPTLGFSVAGDPASIGCAVDQTTTFAPCTSTLTVGADLSEAEHHYYVRAIDAASNVTTLDVAFTVDVTPPSILVDAAVNPTDDPSPTFAFTASADAVSITCALDGGAPFACRSPVTIAGPVPPGAHTFTVTVGDDTAPANTASDSTTYLMTQCGDGVIQGREDCETGNLNGATCTSLGYGAGTLTCSSQCTYDATACGGGYVAANAGINVGTRICLGEGGLRYGSVSVTPPALAACTESDGPIRGAITAATGVPSWSPWNLLNNLIRTTTTGAANASIDVTTWAEHTYEVGATVTFTNAGVLAGTRTVTAVVSPTTFRVTTPSAIAAPIATGTVNSTVNPRGRAILYGFNNAVAYYLAAGTFGRGNYFQSASTTTFNLNPNASPPGGQGLAFDFYAVTQRPPASHLFGSWSTAGAAVSHGALFNNMTPASPLITVSLADPASVQSCTIDNDCPLVCADGNCPPGVTATTRRECFVQSVVHAGTPVANNTWCETGGPNPETATNSPTDCVGRCQVTGTPMSFAYGNKGPLAPTNLAGDNLVAVYGRTPPAGDNVNGVPAVGGIWRACDLVFASNANGAGSCIPGAPGYPCANGVAKGSWNRRDAGVSRTLPVPSAIAGTCGDGTCNSNETRQSCPRDCEADVNLVFGVTADQTTNSSALTCGEAPNPVTPVKGVTRYLAALRGGSRVLRTEDNGVTWTSSGSGIPVGTEVYQIAADCFYNTDTNQACRNDDLVSTNNVFYAATNRGVYRSTDSGNTWTLDGLKDKEVRSVAVEPIPGRQITASSTGSANVVLTTFGSPPFAIGDQVTISGMSLGDSTVLNGTWTVTALAGMSFTINIGATPPPTTNNNTGNGFAVIARPSRVYVGVDDGTKIYRRP